jgi:prephenate dehydratase
MALPNRPRVGYLGPEGTFSEQALLASARPDSVLPVPRESIYDVVTALREGEVEYALVPIENSLEGSISVTLDLLAEDASGVEIVAEALLRVSHCLIAHEQIALQEIDTVVSHPQVLGQCARLLRGELSAARALPASSSAEAVRTVAAERRRGLAAIGTPLAASIYGAEVLREEVQDRRDNETRFAWLARAGLADERPLPACARSGMPVRVPAEEANFKTSLVFWGSGADRPGWLVRCLGVFAERDINLTKIESRPRRERLGSYMFFADLSGHLSDPAVAEALEEVRSLCAEVRVLGSYREASARANAEPPGASGR